MHVVLKCLKFVGKMTQIHKSSILQYNFILNLAPGFTCVWKKWYRQTVYSVNSKVRDPALECWGLEMFSTEMIIWACGMGECGWERKKDALYYHGRTKTYTELHTHSNYKFRPLPWTPLSGCLPGLLCCDLSETLHFIIQHIQSAEFLTHDPYLS